ncbi:MAG: hypothetical protein ACE5RM_05690 [Candidatus Nitrosomaritimum aestuariumsis]
MWLTYNQERYVAKLDSAKRILNWSGKKETWDYNDCDYSIVGIDENLFRLIARRTKSFDSSYLEKKVNVNLMLGFKVKKAHKPIEDQYPPPCCVMEEGKKYGQKRKRWVMHLDTILENKDPEERPITDCCIWQWAENNKDQDIAQSSVFSLYNKILEQQKNPPPQTKIFQIQTEKHDRIIPVLYQPRVDAWKNFVREIHVHKKTDNELEVTIIFNDEQLRKHSPLDFIYRMFRRFRYKRIKDIESFIVKLDTLPKYYTFENIYSGKYTLFYDSVHEDKPDTKGGVPIHEIKYYFSNTNHPIVFVNTSNHALAEHDNNHYHWKWEYAAWEELSPVIYGTKSRQSIDNEFRRVK